MKKNVNVFLKKKIKCESKIARLEKNELHNQILSVDLIRDNK
jgi:hypothetical protein